MRVDIRSVVSSLIMDSFVFPVNLQAHKMVHSPWALTYYKPQSDTHVRLVGPAFWHELSMWEDAYTELLSVIGEHAKNGLQTHKSKAVFAISQIFFGHGILPREAV